MTSSAPRSSISRIRCQRRPCSCIHSKVSLGGQYPRRPTWTKLRPLTAPDSIEAAHRCAMAREHAVRLIGRVSMRIEVDDADRPRPTDLGDRCCGGPGDRVVATEDDRDRPRFGHFPDLPIDHRVATLDPRRDDVGVAGVHDRQVVVRVDVELERMDRAGRVLRLADRTRSEPGAGSVGYGVVEWRADDGHVDLSTAQLGWVRDPWQVHERGRTDIRRQVEVLERIEWLIPSVVGREVTLEVGVWALSHGNLRRRRDGGRDRSVPSRRSAAGSNRRPAGRARDRSTATAGAMTGHSRVVGCARRSRTYSALAFVLPSAFD